MEVFSLYDLISKNLPQRANHIALEKSNDSMTYADIDRRCDQVAGFLHSVGVKRGDRVGIYMARSFEEIIIMFSLSRIGAVYVNLNHQWKTRQLEHVIKDCGIRLLFTDSYQIHKIYRSGILDELNSAIVIGECHDYKKVVMYSDIGKNYKAPSTRVIDSDLATLIYTSGSTGKPKGVMLSHSNIIQGARIVSSYLKNTGSDRVLALLPFSFDYGLSQVTTMFYCGGTVVLQSVMFPAEIVRTIIDKEITGLAGVPSLWISLTGYLADNNINLTALRYITNSGGGIPKQVLMQMSNQFQGVDIYLMYGLTEAFRSTYLPPQNFLKKMGSMGWGVPNVDIFVVDSEKGLCAPGETGELLHRGSLISQGYWGKEDATANKIKPCPHLEHIIGKEKVLYSGDFVRVDEDGCIWFVGRKDCMIKSSGHRISPSEIEDVVYESSLVSNAHAFGVPDEEKGQVIHVAVSLLSNDLTNVDEIMGYCNENLPSYMIPKKIHVLRVDFPLNSNGKFDKEAIIQLCKFDNGRSMIS